MTHEQRIRHEQAKLAASEANLARVCEELKEARAAMASGQQGATDLRSEMEKRGLESSRIKRDVHVLLDDMRESSKERYFSGKGRGRGGAGRSGDRDGKGRGGGGYGGGRP